MLKHRTIGCKITEECKRKKKCKYSYLLDFPLLTNTWKWSMRIYRSFVSNSYCYFYLWRKWSTLDVDSCQNIQSVCYKKTLDNTMDCSALVLFCVTWTLACVPACTWGSQMPQSWTRKARESCEKAREKAQLSRAHFLPPQFRSFYSQAFQQALSWSVTLLDWQPSLCNASLKIKKKIMMVFTGMMFRCNAKLNEIK